MPYGICHLGIVPVRHEPSNKAEMVTQLLFGELLHVIDKYEKWSFIKIIDDGYQGWIDNKQFTTITDKEYRKAQKKTPKYAHKPLTKLNFKHIENETILVTKGATLTHNGLLNISISTQKSDKESIVETALEYLNTPYLWGGKTLFGIDCSGFTQMVYKLNGIQLFRDAYQQATQGELISFLEESKPGDLAFFDNEEERIIHVGILLGDNRIIHAHGKVRIDRIDHVGIFNTEIRNYSHKLRMMKRVLLKQ